MVMLNSLTWLTFSFYCLHIYFIHVMFDILSSQTRQTFRFLASLLCASSPASVLKKPFLTSLKDDIVLLHSVFFFTFFELCLFYISLSNQCSHEFPRLQLVVSFSIKTLNSLMISFSFLVSFLLCLLLYSSLLVFATI